MRAIKKCNILTVCTVHVSPILNMTTFELQSSMWRDLEKIAPPTSITHWTVKESTSFLAEGEYIENLARSLMVFAWIPPLPTHQLPLPIFIFTSDLNLLMKNWWYINPCAPPLLPLPHIISSLSSISSSSGLLSGLLCRKLGNCIKSQSGSHEPFLHC